MYLYTLLGAALVVVCYILYKPLLKLLKSIKIKRPLQKDIDSLNTRMKKLEEDMDYLYRLNNETQKTNELLFPQNFDKDKVEGATVFIKDGEEKKYETIDWRSR